MSRLLVLQHAKMGFAGKTILKDVSLEIDAGASLALIGSNGAGKTTFLKTLAGILPLVGGSMCVSAHPDGTPVKIGYIPQRALLNGLLPLKASEVVEMGTYGTLRPWQGLGQAERTRVEWSLKEVEIFNLRNEPFSFLSGGQQQRVLIARALASNPDILLLDEPLASLDYQSIQTMLALFTKLQEDVNLAVIWADHALPGLGGVLRETLIIENGIVRRQEWEPASHGGKAEQFLQGDLP